MFGLMYYMTLRNIFEKKEYFNKETNCNNFKKSFFIILLK